MIVGNDLGVMLGTVAGNIDDAAVFAETPGKGQAKACQQSRPQFRENDAPENGERRCAEHAARFFIRRVELFQDRLDGPDDEGNPDEDHGDGQADLGIGNLYAVAGKETAEEARIGIELGQGDAGDGRRQGEGQFDDAIQEAFARELIAYQDPGQDKAEDTVHQRRQDGTGNAGDEGVADTAVGDELGIVIGRQL